MIVAAPQRGRGELLTKLSVAEHTYMVIQLGILAAFVGS
jgi:hypothetical protein